MCHKYSWNAVCVFSNKQKSTFKSLCRNQTHKETYEQRYIIFCFSIKLCKASCVSVSIIFFWSNMFPRPWRGRLELMRLYICWTMQCMFACLQVSEKTKLAGQMFRMFVRLRVRMRESMRPSWVEQLVDLNFAGLEPKQLVCAFVFSWFQMSFVWSKTALIWVQSLNNLQYCSLVERP